MKERLVDLSQLRLLVAEDQTLLRQALVALLELDVGEVVEASDGEEALQLLQRQQFDVALIDIGLPRRTGLDVLEEIRKREIPVRVIILTGDTDKYTPADILALGANGFMYKTVDADVFLATLSSVMLDEPQVEKPTASPHKPSTAELRETLTPRERQIVKLIAEGNSNKAISTVLSISEHTVRKHREHINSKLAIKSPAALVMFALKSGIA